MDDKARVEPHRITKPIQLLAAWLTGLFSVNGSFLAAAAVITSPSWVPASLVVAAIVNVPIFLIALFLLQTRFRPEMQEDSYYSHYLESKRGSVETTVTASSVATLRTDVAKLEAVVAGKASSEQIQVDQWSRVRVLVNKHLDDFGTLSALLSKHNIPVHETFGGAKPPNKSVLSIVLGNGFSVAQIRQICQALSDIGNAWISFAHDDHEEDEYLNQVLVGAYGSYKHGIPIQKAVAALAHTGMTEDAVYSMLGRNREN